MNCKQAEELLPMYAGHELEENYATLVTEHLQTCAACAHLAGEYRESIQWTEQFAPPVFSDAVYAEMRQRVMRDIEAEAMAPAWVQTVENFFRPRLTWAIATVLLIAISLFAVYFIVNKQNNEPQLADMPPGKVQPETKEDFNSGSQGGNRMDISPPVKAGGKKDQLISVSKPQRKRSGDTLAGRMNTVAATTPDARTTARDSAAPGKTLRVEILTKDPNIRIIWFVQQETKPAIQSSKGT